MATDFRKDFIDEQWEDEKSKKPEKPEKPTGQMVHHRNTKTIPWGTHVGSHYEPSKFRKIRKKPVVRRRKR